MTAPESANAESSTTTAPLLSKMATSVLVARNCARCMAVTAAICGPGCSDGGSLNSWASEYWTLSPSHSCGDASNRSQWPHRSCFAFSQCATPAAWYLETSRVGDGLVTVMWFVALALACRWFHVALAAIMATDAANGVATTLAVNAAPATSGVMAAISPRHAITDVSPKPGRLVLMPCGLYFFRRIAAGLASGRHPPWSCDFARLRFWPARP